MDYLKARHTNTLNMDANIYPMPIYKVKVREGNRTYYFNNNSGGKIFYKGSTETKKGSGN